MMLTPRAWHPLRLLPELYKIIIRVSLTSLITRLQMRRQNPFNSKIKAFRNALRGMRDIEFFLFRLAKLYT